MTGDVSPQAQRNLAARAAGWSARRRWAVVLGWLAFVVAAFAIGSAAGVVQMTGRRCDRRLAAPPSAMLAREFPSERAGEQVLIQSRSGPLRARPARAPRSTTSSRGSRASPAVAAIRSPLDAAQRRPALQGRALGAA